jgi:hypothetical protein
VLSPEQAIKQSQEIEQAIKKSEEKVTVKFKVAAVQTLRVSNSNVIFDTSAGCHEVFILTEGDRFVVQILPPAMDTIRRLGILDKHFKGKVAELIEQGPHHGAEGVRMSGVRRVAQRCTARSDGGRGVRPHESPPDCTALRNATRWVWRFA